MHNTYVQVDNEGFVITTTEQIMEHEVDEWIKLPHYNFDLSILKAYKLVENELVLDEAAAEKARKELEAPPTEPEPDPETSPEQIVLKAMMNSPAVLRMATPYLMDEDVPTVATYIQAWEGNATKYLKGEIVTYQNDFYRVLQEHTSQNNWFPSGAVSLFTKIGDPEEEWNPWVQPTGAHNAYAIGDKVTYNSKKYISKINANTTRPGSDAGQWEEVK